MRNIAGFIALAVLAPCLLLAGRSSVADGYQCETSSSPVAQKAVWRMEVREGEATYTGPSIHDRLTYNWTNDAKRSYRWTSAAMPVDAGASTRLMAISAAIIGEGLPLLERGDIVDVAAAVAHIDYSQGRASVIVQRICPARDEACLDQLRRAQGGKVSGVQNNGGDLVATHSRSSPVLANGSCSVPKDGCRGEVAAVHQ